MDINYLQSFITVVEAGSYAEAARRLDLTSAAVAARIKALEDDMGIVLIKRSGRSVKPTESGMRILDSTRSVVRQIRDIRALAIDRNSRGEFRLGCFVSALTNILPPILKHVYRLYPEASIFVTPGASIELCRQVAEGELDAAIVVEPQFAVAKHCVWQKFMEEPLLVIAPAHMRGRAAHDVLTSEPFLRYDRSIYGGQLADRYLRDHDLHPTQRLEINSLSSIAVMVHEGLGVSLLPDWSAMWQSLDIVQIPLPERAPVRRNGLVWNPQGHHANLATCIYEQAQAVFGTGSSRGPAR